MPARHGRQALARKDLDQPDTGQVKPILKLVRSGQDHHEKAHLNQPGNCLEVAQPGPAVRVLGQPLEHLREPQLEMAAMVNSVWC